MTYRVHTHIFSYCDDEHVSTSGQCAEFIDGSTPEHCAMLLLERLEHVQHAGSMAFTNSECSIQGNVYEGYVVEYAYQRHGHAHRTTTRLFIDQERCDPTAVHADGAAVRQLLDR